MRGVWGHHNSGGFAYAACVLNLCDGGNIDDLHSCSYHPLQGLVIQYGEISKPDSDVVAQDPLSSTSVDVVRMQGFPQSSQTVKMLLEFLGCGASVEDLSRLSRE